MVTHLYHVYAGGEWRRPVAEHFRALKASGLWGVLDHVLVGIVGPDAAISEVKDALPDGCDVAATAGAGFEQVTLDLLPEVPGDVVLYCHTKGSHLVSARQDAWRRTMLWFNVMEHRSMMRRLRTHDTAGIWWIPEPVHPRPHYQGNFWWANRDYLQRLQYPLPSHSRWEAELWLGSGDPRAWDAYPGSEGERSPVEEWIHGVDSGIEGQAQG